MVILGDLADHSVEIDQDLVVHLDYARPSILVGLLDQGEGPAAMLAQFGQELWAGNEHWASEAPLTELTAA
jgi:hypothetical protein